MATRADLSNRTSAAHFSAAQQKVIDCLRQIAHDIEVAPSMSIGDGFRKALRNYVQVAIIAVEESRRPPAFVFPGGTGGGGLTKFENSVLDRIEGCFRLTTTSLARMGADPGADGSAASSSSMLDYVTGACDDSADVTCTTQRTIVLGTTAVGGALGGFFGGIAWGLVGAIAANLLGRRFKTLSGAASSPCLSKAGLDSILQQIAANQIDDTHAENLARTYEASCPDDAKTIRDAAAAAKATHDATKPPPPPPPVGGVPIFRPIAGGFRGAGAVVTSPAGSPDVRFPLVTHALTADEAAQEVYQFRQSAGFDTDDDFLAANPDIAVYAPSGGWPPNYDFSISIPVGDPTAPTGGGFFGGASGGSDFHFETRSYSPTGKIAAGPNVPSYIEKETGHEVYFPTWNKFQRSDGSYEEESFPLITTNSAGQRMSLERGVWAWDEGMVVNVKAGSSVAKEAA